MDKVTCIAYLLYHTSKNPFIKEKAIFLLNGDVSIHELKKEPLIKTHLVLAESLLRRNKIDKAEVNGFVNEFMVVEV